jgi:hypothetical protein
MTLLAIVSVVSAAVLPETKARDLLVEADAWRHNSLKTESPAAGSQRRGFVFGYQGGADRPA